MDPEPTRVRVSRPISASTLAMRYAPPEAPATDGNSRPKLSLERGRVPPDIETVEQAAGATDAAEYVPDLVLIVRADGTILYANRALGAVSAEDLIGSSIYDWTFPDQHDALRASLDRVFRTRRSDGCVLAGLAHADTDAWYDCRIAPNLRDGGVVSATLIARDITHHKRAELELLERHRALQTLLEERGEDLARAKARLAEAARERDVSGAAPNTLFRTVLDAAGEAVFITDRRSGQVVDVNETACRWLRTTRAALIGKAPVALDLEFPILPPEDGDLQFTETRDTRRPLILAAHHRRSDGSSFPVEVAVAEHVIGQEAYVLAVVRDIKGRQRAEDALAESEARYRTLFEQSWDAIYATSRGGEVQEANRAAVELFGYPHDELIGFDARELLARPDDIRRFQQAMRERGAVERLDVELRLADGATVAGIVSATQRHDRDGKLVGYLWIVRARRAPHARAGARASEPTAARVESPAMGAGTARDGVLVVDEDVEAGSALAEALEQAGWRVLRAHDLHDALERYRADAASIGVTVFGAEPQDPGIPKVIEALHRIDPDAVVILVTADDPLALGADVAHLGVRTFLRKPPHPLALVQAVRDVLGAPAT